MVKRSLVGVALVTLAFGAAIVPIAGARSAQRPNIVVIITDDQRAELMDRMPTVSSQLVQKGMRFDDAFAVDPLCCPSRMSFLRGQYSHTTGVYNVKYQFGGWNYVHAANLESETLPVWLHRDGYFTAEAGKYLNGYNVASWIPPGWDFWRGMLQPGYAPGTWNVSDQGVAETPNAYSSDAVSDYAVQSIAASGSQPIFLWAAYYGPHNPSVPPPRYRTDALAPECANLDVTSLPGFDEARTDHVDGVHDKPRWLNARQPFSPERIVQFQSDYKNQCRADLAVDDGVGRILAALQVKDPGLRNTIVVFTSDQGVEDGVHQQAWKKVPWDGSAQLPLVVRADGLLGGTASRSDDLILNIDLAPTVLALTGASGLPGCPTGTNVYVTTCLARGGGFDGMSFAPLLAGGAYDPRTSFLIEHWDPVAITDKVPMYCAVRTATGMLTRYFANAASGPDWEGYDLTTDPNMLHSLVFSGTNGVPQFRPGGQALYQGLIASLVSLCDPRPPEYPSIPFTPTDATVALTMAGDGGGAVTSDPPGMACTTDCSHAFVQGTTIRLTAAPDATSVFTGWSGPAGCAGLVTCAFPLGEDRAVTATFQRGEPLSVAAVGGGGGRVLSDPGGVACGATCRANFLPGTRVVLTAVPDADSAFVGWTGEGCEDAETCVVTMDQARDVTARFVPVQRHLTVAVEGAGTVTESPGPIVCAGPSPGSGTCSDQENSGTPIHLVAIPDPGAALAGWSGGGCDGIAPTCDLTLHSDQTVTATFEPQAATTTLRDGDPAVAYDGWAGDADPAALGGSERLSATRNDTARWTSPKVTSIAWVAREGPDGGEASVSVDGVKKGTVDLYSATPGEFDAIYSGLKKKAHTIVITVLHTKNIASSGYHVRIDAFQAGATTAQDSSPAIRYDTWKGVAQAQATDGTYRTSSARTATATVTFTGSAIDWTTARGRACGKASVTIDGVAEGTVDLYRATAAWRSEIRYTGLAPGLHTMTIHVLGEKDAAATGAMVVVDGFVVHS